MQIFIKLLTGGESIPLTVQPSYSVDHVKTLLEDATNIPAYQQIFSLGSLILENGHFLSEYNIQHESTIHLKLGAVGSFDILMPQLKMVDAVLKVLEVHANIKVERSSVQLPDKDFDSSPTFCGVCDEEPPVEAMYSCRECKGLQVCLKCKEAHLKAKFSRNHTIFQLQEGFKSQDAECQKHPGKVIEYCCKPCHFRACATCAIVDKHRNHDMVSLPDGIAEERAKLEQAMSGVQQLFDEKLAHVTKRQNSYVADVTSLKAMLNDLADRFIALFNERRALALAEIDSRAGLPLEQLGAEKAAVEGLVSRSRSCGRVAQRLLQEGSDAEIYELSPLVQQTVAALTEQNLKRDGDAVEAREEGATEGSAVKVASGAGIGALVADSAASEVSFTLSDAVIKKMTELVESVFVVEEKLPPAPPAPANAFNPVELDPGYKSSNITLNSEAPRTLSSTVYVPHQILCKKGLLVQPGSGAFGYFEARVVRSNGGGHAAIGFATREVNLNTSLGSSPGGCRWYPGGVDDKLFQCPRDKPFPQFKVGDTIGLMIDCRAEGPSKLRFFVNGQQQLVATLPDSCTGLTIYPALHVHNGEVDAAAEAALPVFEA